MSKNHPQNFPKSLRLLRPADFARISKTGKKRFSKSFVLIFVRQATGFKANDCARGSEELPDAGALCKFADSGEPRIGITTSRKVGKAVARNRIKRGVREWFRRHRAEIAPGIDYLVIARKEASERNACERDAELKNLFEGSAK